jgi:hypothetical protein
MSYGELIQMYFERSVAIQWYWTVYIVVIGGVGAFSVFRQHPEVSTTAIVTILYLGFAYKNLGAIETTAEERAAVRLAAQEYLDTGPNANEAHIKHIRDRLTPTMQEYSIPGARYFHLFCDLLVVVFLWTKEWLRRQRSDRPAAPVPT